MRSARGLSCEKRLEGFDIGNAQTGFASVFTGLEFNVGNNQAPDFQERTRLREGFGEDNAFELAGGIRERDESVTVSL